MEDLKIDTNKLNKAIEPAADLPRLPDGTIDLEKISKGKTEKGAYIVPDEVLEKYYKELPDGTINESGNSWASCNGILRMPSEEVRRKGAEALNARNAQRRKLSETIDIMLKKKASPEEIEELGLEAGATKQDAMIAALMLRAIDKGDVQAGIFLRDTAGEKPTDKIDASIAALTPEDQALINRVASRIEKG